MLEFLFGPNDPTRHWPPPSGEQLKLDLDAGSLNSVRVGQQLVLLSWLGPCENSKRGRYGEFCYYSRGLCLEGGGGDDQRIGSLQAILHDPDEPEYQPFAGRVVAGGRNFDLRRLTLDGFVVQFGDPYWIDRDDDESLLFYEFGALEWQVEFDPQGLLKRVTVPHTPLLADAAQRKLFGVSKPWPAG